MKLSALLPAFAILCTVVAPADGSPATASQRVRRQQETETEPSKGKKTIALALNGGSFSAGNGCGSFMRGFQQQMVTIDGEQRPALEAFKYISALSGGNLATMQYHYAQHTTSDEILDAAGNSDPSKITMEDLEVIPEKSLFAGFVVDVTATVVAALVFSMILGIPELWPLALSFHFLQKKGLATGTLIDDAKVRDDVKSIPIHMTSMLGPAETFPNYEFYTMSRALMLELYDEHPNGLQKIELPGYPETNFYQMDNDYLLQLAEKHNYQFPFPAFLTDQGLEVPFTKEVVIKYDNVVNRTADDVNFKPVDSSYAELSSESNPFTVEKVLGLATDVILLYAQMFGMVDIFQSIGPVQIDIPTADGERRMVFSDGGYNELTGIPPLVKMKTDKIVSVVNPPGPITANIAAQVALGYGSYFGMIDPRVVPFLLDYFSLANGYFNHMFDLYSNGENQILKLIDNLESLKAAGEPLITTLKNVTVVNNPFWGIEGGWTLDLTIILGVGVPDKFALQLPEGIATPPPNRSITENGFFTNEEFTTVPNVAPAPIERVNLSIPIPFTDETIDFPFFSLGNDVPVKEARMTQIMNSWIIGHAWDELKGADGEVKFEGFKKLFEEEEEEGMAGTSLSDEGSNTSSVSGAPMVSFVNAQIISMATAVGMMVYFTIESFY